MDNSMTDKQLEAVKDLASRYKSANYNVLADIDGTGIMGLPPGWILVNIHRPDNTIIIQAGISPEGNIST